MKQHFVKLGWLSMLAVALAVTCRPGMATQSYSGSGLVLQVNPQHNEVVVSMKEIPGFMEAMVMPLPVPQAKELRGINPGMLVDFTLVVAEATSYVENLRVHRFESYENDPQGACRLAVIEKVFASNSKTALALGDHVPDFTLTDQNGRPLSLSQFAGKVVAITFVYTRCPLPNFCFRLSNNFGQLQKRYAKQMGHDLILLTITLDPTTDGPDALARYATVWKANTNAWHFLTGSPADVRKVTSMFSVVSNSDEGTVTHSLHTVIIDRQGDVAANLEGNEFTGTQLGDLVEAELAKPTPAVHTERVDNSSVTSPINDARH